MSGDFRRDASPLGVAVFALVIATSLGVFGYFVAQGALGVQGDRAVRPVGDPVVNATLGGKRTPGARGTGRAEVAIQITSNNEPPLISLTPLVPGPLGSPMPLSNAESFSWEGTPTPVAVPLPPAATPGSLAQASPPGESAEAPGRTRDGGSPDRGPAPDKPIVPVVPARTQGPTRTQGNGREGERPKSPVVPAQGGGSRASVGPGNVGPGAGSYGNRQDVPEPPLVRKPGDPQALGPYVWRCAVQGDRIVAEAHWPANVRAPSLSLNYVGVSSNVHNGNSWLITSTPLERGNSGQCRIKAGAIVKEITTTY